MRWPSGDHLGAGTKVRGLLAALAHQRKPHRGPRWRVGVELHYFLSLLGRTIRDPRSLSPRADISPAYVFTQEEMRLTPGYG
jgi:hypothetical protein